jgi:hypothetical protein
VAQPLGVAAHFFRPYHITRNEIVKRIIRKIRFSRLAGAHALIMVQTVVYTCIPRAE